jgi:hypothetical protein
MFGLRALVFLIVAATAILAAEKICSREPTPRSKDGKTYRQWCCTRCETWNSAYGPPYVCQKCGKSIAL